MPLRSWLVAIVLLVVAAGLIVCHGCHAGDHDDELRIPPMDEPSGARLTPS